MRFSLRINVQRKRLPGLRILGQVNAKTESNLHPCWYARDEIHPFHPPVTATGEGNSPAELGKQEADGQKQRAAG